MRDNDKTIMGGSRITVIDAMRGIALVGICLTHAMQYFGEYPASPIRDSFAWIHSLDEAMRWFVNYFLAAKFYIIFSFLFGLSFFIQMDRASQKGVDFRPRFLWRLVLLLMIGMLHNLIFPLDILVIYAVLGFPLVLMYKLPNKLLVGLACFFMLGGVQLGVVAYQAWNDRVPEEHVRPQSRSKQRIGRPEKASFGDAVYNNMTVRLDRKIRYQISSGRGFMTLGLFIMGLVVGRIRLFHHLDEYRKKLYVGAAVSAVLLFALYMIRPHIPRGDPNTFVGWISMPVTNAINLLTAYLWMVGIVWVYGFGKARQALAPMVSYGRLGLTNYVVQSVVGVFAFYGFGLGLNQYFGTFAAVVFCVGYTVLQIYGSHFWLKKFRYGPLEWLWRSGTYMRWQPLYR